MLLVQVQYIGTGTKYGLELLHKCDKSLETKDQKVSGASFYVCRSYMGKKLVGDGGFLVPFHPK